MKKYLLLFTALTLSSSAHAADMNCNPLPDCADLGFSMTATDCEGQFSLKCPFDNTKLFCKKSINDGATCQNAISSLGKVIKVTSLDQSLSSSNTKYLYPETIAMCSTNSVTLGAGSLLISYCLYPDHCYCASRPRYCYRTITLNDNSSIAGIDVSGVSQLTINGSTSFMDTALRAVSVTLNKTANDQIIGLVGDSEVLFDKLTAVHTDSPVYDISMNAGTRLEIGTITKISTCSSNTSQGVATINIIMDNSTEFIYNGTTYKKTELTSGSGSVTCSIIASNTCLNLSLCK